MWTSLHAHKIKALQRNSRANFKYIGRFLKNNLKKIFLKNLKNSVDKFLNNSYNQKQVQKRNLKIKNYWTERVKRILVFTEKLHCGESSKMKSFEHDS